MFRLPSCPISTFYFSLSPLLPLPPLIPVLSFLFILLYHLLTLFHAAQPPLHTYSVVFVVLLFCCLLFHAARPCKRCTTKGVDKDRSPQEEGETCKSTLCCVCLVVVTAVTCRWSVYYHALTPVTMLGGSPYAHENRKGMEDRTPRESHGPPHARDEVGHC